MKLIVAMSQDGVIGVRNELPWTVPSELKLFKALTKDSPVIMGRKTYESLPSGPLKGRTNVVVSRTMGRDTRVITERLISRVGHYKGAFIIGGASLYGYALDNDLVDELHVTLMDIRYDSDIHRHPETTRFPWEWTEIMTKYTWTTRTRFKAREGDECGYIHYHLVKKEAV